MVGWKRGGDATLQGEEELALMAARRGRGPIESQSDRLCQFSQPERLLDVPAELKMLQGRPDLLGGIPGRHQDLDGGIERAQ